MLFLPVRGCTGSAVLLRSLYSCMHKAAHPPSLPCYSLIWCACGADELGFSPVGFAPFWSRAHFPGPGVLLRLALIQPLSHPQQMVLTVCPSRRCLPPAVQLRVLSSHLLLGAWLPWTRGLGPCWSPRCPLPGRGAAWGAGGRKRWVEK